MNRAAKPRRSASGSPSPGTTGALADPHADPAGLNGAMFDPAPEPPAVQMTLAEAADQEPTAHVPAMPAIQSQAVDRTTAEPSLAAAGELADEPNPEGTAGAQSADAGSRTIATLKPAIRVVGTPVPPEAARQSSDLALKNLPVAVVNRRRMAWILGLAVTVWVVAVFARQVGEASAAADHADVVRNQNAALSAQVLALQHERDTLQQQSFVEFQARTYGLGSALEKRFTLAADAPPLPSNAPGSASLKLAPPPSPQTPLDAWLALLFGPSR